VSGINTLSRDDIDRTNLLAEPCNAAINSAVDANCLPEAFILCNFSHTAEVGVWVAEIAGGEVRATPVTDELGIEALEEAAAKAVLASLGAPLRGAVTPFDATGCEDVRPARPFAVL
jgi:hypothetical protein